MTKLQSWSERLTKIKEIFVKYSFYDVITSLLSSYLWIPNIASPIRHTLLFSIAASMPSVEYQKENHILKYEHFENFIKEISDIVPSFPLLEDYVPEADWGDVKFNHQNTNYKIFYGNELETVYDFLALFQLIYLPFDAEFISLVHRSPNEELATCIKLQNHILSNLHQKSSDDISKYDDLVIPSLEFWQEIKDYIDSFNPELLLIDEKIIDLYSVNLGDYKIFDQTEEDFSTNFMTGKILPYYLIKDNGKYYPLAPRRYSSILLDKLANLFNSNKKAVRKKDAPFNIEWGIEIHKYIKGRLKADHIFPVVSAIDEKGHPHSIIYSIAALASNKLLLIYLLDPPDDIATEMSKFAEQFKESLELIKKQPITLALHLKRQNVSFTSSNNAKNIELYPIVLIPDYDTQLLPTVIPIDEIPGNVLGLREFLAIIDEVDSIKEFVDFFDSLNNAEFRLSGLSGITDVFAAYKDSKGVIVSGATTPTHLFIDPHWGSNYRYRSLRDFWNIYPPVDFFDHPRTWHVSQETKSRVRLEARGYFGSAIYCLLGTGHLFCNAPFQEMDYDQARLSNLLMECLEDTVSFTNNVIQNLHIFLQYSQFQVSFFPKSLVQNNTSFVHLKHLIPINKIWIADIGYPAKGVPGIRFVFDDSIVQARLLAAKDNSLEIELLMSILDKLNSFVPDTQLSAIKREAIKILRGKKPRFKLFSINKKIAFPDLSRFDNPLESHFKLVHKRVAEIAKEIGIAPGEYDVTRAEEIIRKLRGRLVTEVNAEINKYDFSDITPKLIGMIDSITHSSERDKLMVEQSISMDIDYDRAEKYSEANRKYITNHKNYRYLLEKCVQLKPTGKTELTQDRNQYLLALIDFVHIIYEIGDIVHYKIGTIGLNISHDYVVSVKSDPKSERQQKEFGEEQSKFSLGLQGNRQDRVEPPRPFINYVRDFDKAFKRACGFRFLDMLSVCDALSMWPYYTNEKVETYYCSNIEKIIDICSKNIKKINSKDIPIIVDFLTLKSENVLRIIDEPTLCDDIPVWEISKRPHRYMLKPLINIDGKYCWGPYSTSKTKDAWTGRVQAYSAPYQLQNKEVLAVLENEKKLIEKALENKSFEITKRFTKYVEKNLKFHKRDKRYGHPAYLGEYDVLAYLENKNIILNIECKDVLQVFCLKDAKRLREKIFGDDKNRGYIDIIEKRADYLKSNDNIARIMTVLRWPHKAADSPKVISVYVSRYLYWWTMFPSRETPVNFIRIDTLGQFIKALL